MANIKKLNTTSLYEIQGAILDCDGTLINSLGAWQGIESHLIKSSHASVTKEERQIFATLTIPEISAYFHEHYGLASSAEEVARIIDEYMIDYYANKSTLLPGVAEFLSQCASLDIQMCIVSSSPKEYLVQGARHTGIEQYFKEIISVDDLNTSKREPAIFNHACELLGTKTSSTWGFEDSTYAIKTLAGAGFKTVGIFDKSEGLSFSDWEDLADIAVYSFEQLTVV